MLASAAQTLLVVRQYALAADLFEAANKTANVFALVNMIQILKKTRRLEDQDGTIRRPEDALRIFLARLFNFEHDPNGWRAPLSSLLLEEEDIDDVTSMKTAMTAALAKLKSSGLTLETALDIGISSAQFSAEGSDENGWVIRANFLGAGNQQTWFVILENGAYRLLSSPGDYQSVAKLVLKLLEEGKTEQARVWLDRVREELPAGD